MAVLATEKRSIQTNSAALSALNVALKLRYDFLLRIPLIAY